MDLHTFIQDPSAEDLASDAQRAMYEYWQTARNDSQLAPKSTLDPVELPRQCLPLLAVLEPLEGNDFRIRIVGTGVRSSIGRDITGQLVSQIKGAEDFLDCLRQCCGKESTYYAGGPASWASGRQEFFTSLMLPFGSPGHIERILIVFKFTHHMPASPRKSPPQVSAQQA
ncbi:PAS domain-containing protein [Nisaea sp.]|uniref:PAS domain-containing protein n=1 Tax=Nisaea sp. TaxID=2024842 RepID=UPI0032977D8E